VKDLHWNAVTPRDDSSADVGWVWMILGHPDGDLTIWFGGILEQFFSNLSITGAE
jgi:hypothetical protein